MKVNDPSKLNNYCVPFYNCSGNIMFVPGLSVGLVQDCQQLLVKSSLRDIGVLDPSPTATHKHVRVFPATHRHVRVLPATLTHVRVLPRYI